MVHLDRKLVLLADQMMDLQGLDPHLVVVGMERGQVRLGMEREQVRLGMEQREGLEIEVHQQVPHQFVS